MSDTVTYKRAGPGFLGLLTIVLVILKAAGYLPTWSWLWVFAPLWLPIAFVLACIVVALAIYGMLLLYGSYERYAWRRKHYRK